LSSKNKKRAKNQFSTFTFGEILDGMNEDKKRGDHSKSHSLLDKDIIFDEKNDEETAENSFFLTPE
jgi:hypothetical protein